MKRPFFALVLLLGAAVLPGCVTYLISSDVAADRQESERTHYFDFYKQQAMRMAKGGACASAASYFKHQTIGERDRGTVSGTTTRLDEEDLKALDERIKAAARELVDDCLKNEAANLQQARRFGRLSTLFRALATVAVSADEQQALLLRADTTDLLRADAAVEDAQKAWEAGKVYEALDGFDAARSIAGGVKAATDAQKAKYARLLEDKKRAHVDDLLKKADQAGQSAATAHRAVVYLARAYEVSGDKALGRRLAALRAELLAGHVYRWQVEFKGEPRIAQAAKETVGAHQFSGNLQPAGPQEFAAVVDVGSFTVNASEREGSRTGEYKTGSRSYDNPEFRKLQSLVTRQQGCLARLSAGSFWSTNAAFNHQREIGCTETCSSYECARNDNQEKLDLAQEKLERTPMTLDEDVMSPWVYPTREWSQVIAAPVQLLVKHALEAAPRSTTITLQHEYTDHAHELVAQLGLGKRQITKQSDAELAQSAGQKLGSKLVEEIEKDYQAWFAATPKLGERGLVLYILLGGDGGTLDRELEAATGVRNAHHIVRAR